MISARQTLFSYLTNSLYAFLSLSVSLSFALWHSALEKGWGIEIGKLASLTRRWINSLVLFLLLDFPLSGEARTKLFYCGLLVELFIQRKQHKHSAAEWPSRGERCRRRRRREPEIPSLVSLLYYSFNTKIKKIKTF